MVRRYRQQEAFEEPAVNLTPLIDVVFVILIMFIVVAPILELDRVELADASAKTEDVVSVTDPSPVTIYVRKDNTVWLGEQRVNIEQLIVRLQQAKVEYPKARPQLFHDRTAYFGTYQAVKNAVEMAGFKELDIILKPS
jgi:biopolymer transport protein ExbD